MLSNGMSMAFTGNFPDISRSCTVFCAQSLVIPAAFIDLVSLSLPPFDSRKCHFFNSRACQPRRIWRRITGFNVAFFCSSSANEEQNALQVIPLFLWTLLLPLEQQRRQDACVRSMPDCRTPTHDPQELQARYEDIA